jgi:hypothetical protein
MGLGVTLQSNTNLGEDGSTTKFKIERYHFHYFLTSIADMGFSNWPSTNGNPRTTTV